METTPTETPLQQPLTKEELDVLAYMEAAEYAGAIAAREAAMTEDNYGGALLRGDVAFGD